MSAKVAIGVKAPNFTLDGIDGATKQQVRISLEQFRGRLVVVFFYPKDETPGCTAEACSFRDSFQDFTDKGAVVIGISSDTVADHLAFANHHHLPFLLLSDVDGAVRNSFGVPKSLLGLLPGRVTYLLDQEGVCRFMFDSQMQATKHITETMKVIQSLAAPTPAAAVTPASQ